MKTKILFLSLITLSGIMMGCSDDLNPEGTLYPSLTGKYLRVSQNNFNHVSSDAFTDKFNLECSGTSWKFSKPAEWLTVSPSYGSESSSITLDGSENLSADSRTSVFYLESEDKDWNYNSKAISVSQGGVKASLITDPNEVSFVGAGEKKSVLVVANCAWTAKCNQDWVSLEVVEPNELVISASSNPMDTYREATVYLNYGDNLTSSISLTQFPASIQSSDAVLKAGNNATKFELSITSEIEWTAIASESWILVDPDKGSAGETNVSLEVSPNTSVEKRFGYVVFKTGDYDRLQIAIEQDGIFIESTDELVFRSASSAQSFEIRSNTDWEVLSYPDWMTISEKSGSGNAELTATVTENQSASSREGKIEIGQRGLSLLCTVKVTQKGRVLETDETLLEFDDKAGSKSFELISDGEWSSVCSDSWFTVTPTLGNGDATIVVNVEENTNDDERNGVITYTFGNQKSEVFVLQSGKYFNIDNQTFEFSSLGGNHTINVSTNEKWIAEVKDEVDWLSLSEYSGAGEVELTLTVADNPSVNERAAEVVITPENLKPILITVSQKARTLSISTQSVTFYPDGGVSSFIAIDTEGTYAIEGDSTWFAVNESESERGFTVEAQPYKQPGTRTGKITISLTDLEEGSLSLEIEVIQIGEGCSFIVDGYPEDGDWNDLGNSKITITITGYTTDQDWNTKYKPAITINLDGYPKDADWDEK